MGDDVAGALPLTDFYFFGRISLCCLVVAVDLSLLGIRARRRYSTAGDGSMAQMIAFQVFNPLLLDTRVSRYELKCLLGYCMIGAECMRRELGCLKSYVFLLRTPSFFYD